ncbi:hypothetical protein LSCM1_04348 [Leishmania martiniquensis]|uniref:C2H2-type domain-containing protein n=1 Tax=Leishmania martiniquensis TaxID=1580590 RepID=A0A836H1Y1_9TRYP|nr:hypothetical protein LSCM1_04348 [Leishmania martiniquensis]
MPPHYRVPHPSPGGGVSAIHPYDKLVIGLPTAMEEWRSAYGPAREWYKLPPNPAIANPSSTTDEEGSNGRDPRVVPPSRPACGHPGDAAAHPPPSNAPNASEPHSRTTKPNSAAGRNAALYCDACQREFATREKYAAHMDTHMYCTVAGCRFTCRKEKPWRMEEHMELLHNRPDAPNLVDTSAYLEQRKRRFPTQDAVKMKVEELYYKAARGVVLPDERRRWMRQHGILIRKRPRTETSLIVSGELPTGSRSPSTASPASASSSQSSRRSSCSLSEQRPRRSPRSSPQKPPPLLAQPAVSNVGGGRPRFIQPPSLSSYREPGPTASPPNTSTKPSQGPSAGPPRTDPASPPATALPVAASSSLSPGSSAGAHAAPARPTKMIPLGPNGTLTPRQRVQLVRERYAAAKDVPQFYVCHRCGIKGEHWVADCPTKGDCTYDRHIVWGEAKLAAVERGTKPTREKAKSGKNESEQQRPRDAPQQEACEATTRGNGDAEQYAAVQMSLDVPTQPSPGEPRKGSSAERQGEAHPDATCASEAPETAATDVPHDQSEEDAPPVPQSAAPPADAPREVTRMMAPVAAARHAQQNRRDPVRRPPPPPTLYERLTEEARMDEQGVLLQALRFFVARDFFKERPHP